MMAIALKGRVGGNESIIDQAQEHAKPLETHRMEYKRV